MIKIAVIDGQGGGIGKAVIESLKTKFNNNIEILALGTNVFATSVMIKAGTNSSATGENAIVFNVQKMDIIVGTIGIVAANSMQGELSPLMANAISSCDAIKILIPVNKCHLRIVGGKNLSMNEYIAEAVTAVEQAINEL